MIETDGIGDELRILYSPLSSQRRFHQSTARFKGYSGPIGSGKSQALCQEAIRLAHINPGRLGLVGAPTFPMLRDATMSTFFEILDTNSVPFEHHKAENILRLKTCNSRIILRSVDEFERLRGTNLAWFGVDELSYCPEEAWLRLQGRLRDPLAQSLCGFAVWTPKGHDWVFRRFIKERVDGYEVILAKAFENRHILDKIPDFYDRLKSSYDEKFFRQEVLGEYLNANSGRVYSSFNREEHVRNVTVQPYAPLYWTLDFNVNPMCSVIAQKQGEKLAVLDEIVIERATTVDACEEFVARHPNHPADIIVYGDASGENMKTSGATDFQMIRSFFQRRGQRRVQYIVPNSNPAVRDRITLVNARLRNAEGEIGMYVSPKCKELIKDFEEVAYRSDTTLIDKNSDPRRTHLSDALGYLIWQEWRPKTPIGERGHRLI
jgi:hypothetical protein